MSKKVKSRNHLIYYMAAFLVVAFFTAVDQITKYIAILYLKGSDPVVLIPGVLEFRYLENKGMAFGLFSGKTAFFTITCMIFFIAAIYFYIKIPKTSFFLPVIAVEFILTSGALGNFIDRVYRGYVVDFIYFKLINFPIFNVADIYVVISCILLILLIMFRYEDQDFKFIGIKSKG